ncbi:MAG: hypothetical protein PHV17_05570 [Candidatus Omnitrophica bacterium]|nr:hypothetical protein [Candidatus Omnitrophota bacterium]
MKGKKIIRIILWSVVGYISLILIRFLLIPETVGKSNLTSIKNELVYVRDLFFPYIPVIIGLAIVLKILEKK